MGVTDGLLMTLHLFVQGSRLSCRPHAGQCAVHVVAALSASSWSMMDMVFTCLRKLFPFQRGDIPYL